MEKSRESVADIKIEKSFNLRHAFVAMLFGRKNKGTGYFIDEGYQAQPPARMIVLATPKGKS